MVEPSNLNAGSIANMTMLTFRDAVLLVVAAFVMLVVPPTANSAALDGFWEGAFTRLGTAQSVAIDIQTTDSGLVGTYDIPDLVLYREPLTELSLSGDTLVFRLFWGTFTCIVHETIGEITGENLKWGPSVSIHLRRGLKPAPFRVEQLRFQSDSITLVGDLLIPAGNPPFPAVVLIEGSTMGGRSLWSYRSLGDLLARNGIAAFVYDKRGVGASGGSSTNASFGDLSGDAANAVRILAERDDINVDEIGVLGISQGGWLGPLASQSCDSVSFLILVVGPAVSVWDQELHRVEYSMRAGSMNEDTPDSFSMAEIDAARTHTTLGFAVAANSERWSEWQSSVATAKSSRWAAYVALDSSIGELQGWMRQRYDPADVLRRTTVPVLALFGEDDELVPPVENVDLLRDYLAAAGNDDVTVAVFPEVGHSLIRNGTLVGGEWTWPTGFWRWTRKAPGVADTLVSWTRRQTSR
jgi:pimeloyl-ACP methyl ester carboxylesterase